MTGIFAEIVLPLAGAVLIGVLIGWLLWRWRRQVVTPTAWKQLNASTQSAHAELASVRAARAELLAERTLLDDRMADLSTQLDDARYEIRRLRSHDGDDGVVPPT
ncbi:MAG: LPXTG cell wall anchor domain-containing protein [Acidimicrobiales bacterium]|nr:LPXTG cell wall anchor domain-containing protein [Acidimicrobiales bacterium]RZV45829.1 MAG: LPXTG cell wall anchor domain-containing protein [Acidimicrobiales bacterium]